jgi:hypothetical protein
VKAYDWMVEDHLAPELPITKEDRFFLNELIDSFIIRNNNIITRCKNEKDDPILSE